MDLCTCYSSSCRGKAVKWSHKYSSHTVVKLVLLQCFWNMYCISVCRHVCSCVFVANNFPLFWLIFMQVASTKEFLGVQIQNFENFYNAETYYTGGYCCSCDSVNDCKEHITDLQQICTAHSCQPYFLMHIRDSSCTAGTCSLDKTYRLNYEPSTSILDHTELSIPFKEMEWSDYVRTKIC